MKLTDKFTLPARPEKVWAALNDPKVLAAALPGCKSLEMLDERHFESTIQVRVGPVAATFRGQVELADLEPPRAYTIIGSGNAGAAGFAKLTARITLEGQGDTTVLHYDADVEIGGKLMSVGARLIQSVAAKNLESFFSAFAKQLEQPAAAGVAHAAGADTNTNANVNAQQRTQAAALPAAVMPHDAAAQLARPAAHAEVPSAAHAGASRSERMFWTLGAAAGLVSLGLVIGFFAGHAF